ncbi:hypothetical protein AZO1586R_2272 [Bathymodiolus azoricus thioautotrophic gill symbiont]|uniref:Uncharacterized protein n=1 Tax=Bathymodiolus azoricus thioautotrophic gill symbiont TaxID=235205 RepID=A0ACA8ZSX3_9GAMM|nr:hypothetical protein AZO1586R_2272 [Bathymodiolus azoricus thioautotrophic gill symbiont]
MCLVKCADGVCVLGHCCSMSVVSVAYFIVFVVVLVLI